MANVVIPGPVANANAVTTAGPAVGSTLDEVVDKPAKPFLIFCDKVVNCIEVAFVVAFCYLSNC